MRIELLQLTQGTNSFWDFTVQVQSKNSILSGTKSHLTEMQLRHRIESGMSPKLALRSCLEKIETDGTLSDWLTDVKRVDDLIRAER